MVEMGHYLQEELYDLIKNDSRIFDFIQEGSLDGIWYWDLEKPENEWMSNRFWEVLGYDPNEMPHKSDAWKDIIDHDDLNTAMDNFQKHLDDPNFHYDQIVRYQHKNKSTVYIRCRGLAIRNEENVPIRMLGAHQEISANKLAESLLKEDKDKAIEAKEKYQAMYENAPLAFQSLDVDGFVREVNPQWLKTLGYDRKDVIGSWFGDFLHPEFVSHFRKNFPIFKKQGYINDVQFRMKRKDGVYIFVSFEGCVGLDKKGNFKQTYCTFKDITKEKEAEIKVKESENLFRILFEQSAAGLARLSPEGQFIQVNQRFCNIIGYSNEELLRLHFEDITHPDDLVLHKNFMQEIQVNKRSEFALDKRYVNKNGETIWVHLVLNVIRNMDESVDYFIASVFDITSKKEAQMQLKEQRDLFEIIINSVPTRIFWKDLNSDYLGCNKHFASDSGIDDPKKIVGKNDDDLIWKEDADIFRRDDKTVMESGIPKENYEEDFISKDGEHITWRTNKNPLRDNTGKVIGVVATAENITDAKLAENKLRESEERFELAMNATRDGLFDWNLETNEIYYSPTWKSMLGYQYDELPNDFSVWETSTKKEDVEKSWELQQKLINKEIDRFELEFKMKHKAGHWVDILSRAEAVFNEDGKAIRIVGTHVDITERKKIELQIKEKNEELAQANKNLKEAIANVEEANRLKTEFLHNMSHEIRTPMNGIVGFSDLLNEPEITKEKRAFYTRIVQNSSQQLMRVIDDILEISTLETKKEKLVLSEFVLNDFVMELFSVFSLRAKEQNISIYVKKPLLDKHSRIISDKTKLNKILSNLLENAMKFTFQGYIEFGYFIENSRLVLYVKDTGIGIDPENHESIFERFSQEEKEISSKQGGLGLGLSISKENAKLLGGDITLESEKGKGATFYVNIPYEAVDTIAEVESDTKSRMYTILLAEDEEVNSLYIQALLEGEPDGNYRIIHAKNGKDAVEICEKNKIDLVLMDIKMPIMSGYEATEIIKEKEPTLPVIAQTAYSSETDRVLALEHGCDSFISKPIDKDEFFDVLEKYLK